jgi:hypothetical protein
MDPAFKLKMAVNSVNYKIYLDYGYVTVGSFQKAGLPRCRQVLFWVERLPCSRALGRPKAA